MIIDIHTHIGFNAKRLFKGIYPNSQSVKDLLLKMNLAKIDYAVSFPFGASLYDNPTIYYQNIPTNLMEFPYKIENLSLLQNAKFLGEGRILPFLAVDPKRKIKEQITQIETLSNKYKIYGLKVHTKSTQTRADELIGSPFLKLVKEYGWPLLFHSYMQDVAHPIHVLKFALKNPSINVCAAHLGGCIEEFYYEMQKTKPDNLFIDTSPFLASCRDIPTDAKERGYKILKLNYKKPEMALRELVERFGKYLLFGSDEPFTTNVNFLDKFHITSGGLNHEVDVLKTLPRKFFKLISEENPQKFLGLKLKKN